jgi:hypothetical protein
MGIGRREFLRIFGAGIAAVATRPSSAIAIVDDHYINRKLGIAFQKPRGWIFASIEEMGEVKAGQLLDLDDVGLSHEVLASAELPILTISRDGISAAADRFTPGITVYLDRLGSEATNEGHKTVDSADRYIADVQFCANVLKEFRVTSARQVRKISACNAMEYEASFVFEHENMQPTTVRMKTLAIDQTTALYEVDPKCWTGLRVE